MNTRIHLVTRGDDAGGCRSANEAILEAVEAGTIKNVSFMAVGPELKHAVDLLGGRDDICYGFHVVLNAEWEKVKWGPISAAPSLTDENGHFLPFPNDTRQIPGLDFDVVMDEVLAQFQTLRDAGLPIAYLDEHMGVGSIGFRDRLAAFCNEHGLIDHTRVASLPAAGASSDVLKHLQQRLVGAVDGTYVWVTHPGKAAPDMNQFYLRGGEPGIVARERDAERQLLAGEELKGILAEWNVKTCRYDEVAAVA